MTVADAAKLLLENDAPVGQAASAITNRTVMFSNDGRHVIATDSIAFALPEDAGKNVLVTAGHTGRSAVPYLLDARPHGFICSDGGRGMDDSGIVGLTIVEAHGLAETRHHQQVVVTGGVADTDQLVALAQAMGER